MTEIKKERKQKYINNQYYIYYDLADSDYQRRIITYDCVLDTIYNDDIKYKGYKDIVLRNVDALPSDDILIKYLADYKEWIYEAKVKCFKIYSVDFTQGDVQAMQRTFFSLLKGYDNKAKITSTEYIHFENCPNGGLAYLKKDGLEIECTSYDRKMCYANILGSNIVIPTKEGKEYTLNTLPTLDKVRCGIYRVKISTDNEDFRKCFVISKYNEYVDISLRFALEFKDFFDLTIELIQDGNPNAYLYSNTIKLGALTSEWLEKVTSLKKAFPKNPLIKMLASGTWGAIQKKNKLEYTLDEVDDLKLDVGLEATKHKYVLVKRYEKRGVDMCQLLNTDAAYKYQLRLKPWVTAQARDDIGRLALKHLANVVRIQTDSITFNIPIELDDPKYALEAKTTGLIKWYNVNKYHNKTTGYRSKNCRL